MANDPLRDIVSRMVAAGESEENIAAVIQKMSAVEAPIASHRPEPKNALERMENTLRDDGYGSVVEGMRGGGVMTAAPLNTAIQEGPKIIQSLARRLYGGLLKPKQAIKDSFGDATEIAGTLLESRAPISRGGVQKMGGQLAASRNAAMGMVKDAEAQGMQGVVPKDVIGEFKPVVETLRKRADIGQPSELARVGARGKVITKTAARTGGDIPLTRAQALKEEAQDAASGAYRAIERGSQKQLSADDLLDKGVATGLRKGIERKVPGVGPQNARTQTLIGAKNALEDAVEREANNNMLGGFRDVAAMTAGLAGTATGGPALGAGGAAIVRALATPSIGSRAAIGLHEASKLGLDDAMQRALMVVMSQGAHQQ